MLRKRKASCAARLALVAAPARPEPDAPEADEADQHEVRGSPGPEAELRLARVAHPAELRMRGEDRILRRRLCHLGELDARDVDPVLLEHGLWLTLVTAAEVVVLREALEEFQRLLVRRLEPDLDRIPGRLLLRHDGSFRFSRRVFAPRRRQSSGCAEHAAAAFRLAARAELLERQEGLLELVLDLARAARLGERLAEDELCVRRVPARAELAKPVACAAEQRRRVIEVAGGEERLRFEPVGGVREGEQLGMSRVRAHLVRRVACAPPVPRSDEQVALRVEAEHAVAAADALEEKGGAFKVVPPDQRLRRHAETRIDALAVVAAVAVEQE